MTLNEQTLDRILDQLNFNLDAKSLTNDDEYEVLLREELLDDVRDRIDVPTGLKTQSEFYKITKLITPKFNLMTFMDMIIETIPLPFETSINVGFFTFNVNCPDVVKYVKPSMTPNLATASMTSLEHYWQFRKKISKIIKKGIMRTCAVNADDRGHIPMNDRVSTAITLCVYLRRL